MPLGSARYTPFGVPQTSTPDPFGFTGELHSQGLVYLRARWYDPSSGVFVGRDPFAGFPETPYSLHPYQYAYSAPTMWTDATGMVVESPDATPTTPTSLTSTSDSAGDNCSLPPQINPVQVVKDPLDVDGDGRTDHPLEPESFDMFGFSYHTLDGTPYIIEAPAGDILVYSGANGILYKYTQAGRYRFIQHCAGRRGCKTTFSDEPTSSEWRGEFRAAAATLHAAVVLAIAEEAVACVVTGLAASAAATPAAFIPACMAGMAHMVPYALLTIAVPTVTMAGWAHWKLNKSWSEPNDMSMHPTRPWENLP